VRDLARAAALLGHAAAVVDFRRVHAALPGRRGSLSEFDAVVVRTMPPGSLEQVVFRMDALQRLQARGALVLNPPRALECCIDKYLTAARLEAAGLPVPPTVACQHSDDALEAFAALGGDVVVKPLFGAMGNGIVRIEDRDVAHRVFRALELERAVYYVQRTIAPAGRRDLRVLVVAGDIAGAMERVSDSWRANVARGARARGVSLTEAETGLALAAAAALEADVAGVDLLVAPDGEIHVVEVNGIPGWQALQSICADDLFMRVVRSCEALLTA
jgi:ribosomal protein S6--L-glutamate ligase